MTDGNTRSELGERVGRLRRKAGLTQAELARRVGIARPYLAQIERGAIPSADLAVMLARSAGGGMITELELGLLALDHHEPALAQLVRQYVSFLLTLVPPARIPADRPRGGSQPWYEAAWGIIGQSGLFEEVRGLSPQSQWDLVSAVVVGESANGADLTREQIHARVWEALSAGSARHGAHVRHAG